MFHLSIRVQLPATAPVVELGQERGYRHLREPRRLSSSGQTTEVEWIRKAGSTHALIVPPSDGSVIVASDYMPETSKDLGELTPAELRDSIIVRARAASCVFVSLWQFGSRAGYRLNLPQVPADGEIVLATEGDGTKTVWRIPFAHQPVTSARP